MMMALCLNSCGPDNEGGDIDPSFIYGHWQEGTVHEKYLTSGKGLTWDASDDMSEEEALPFDWTLDGNQLIQEHILWDGSIVPKIYTVTTLNATTMVYHDDYGTTHSFQKVLEIAP